MALRDGEIRSEKRSEGKKRQLVSMVFQRWVASRDNYLPQYRSMGHRYRLYRGYRTGRHVPHRANVTVPLGFSMIQSDAARKSAMSLADPEVLTFAAGGPEDQMLARKRSALLNVQMRDANLFDKGTRLFVGGGIFGTYVVKEFWDTKRERVSFRMALDGSERVVEQDEVTFDGPNFDLVDPRNFFPEPGKARIRDMHWVVERFFMEKEEVNRLAELGFFERRGAADLALEPTRRGQFEHDDISDLRDPASGGFDQNFRVSEFDRPVEILQMWGRVPRDFAVRESQNLVITVGGGKHLLRAVPNPHGHLPFKEYAPMPDPLYFFAPSKMEVVEKLQVATNAFASQKVDAYRLFADPQFLVNEAIVPQGKKLYSRPGVWHKLRGEVGESNIRPLTPDIRMLTNMYTELEQHAQWMEQGTGIVRDAIQGLGGPDRETARGFLGRQEGANTRLLMEARFFERLVLEPMAMDFVRMNRSFLTLPRQLEMIGASAVVDPITLLAAPQDLVSIGVNDLLPDYDARALGSTRSIGKSAQLQNYVLLTQLMQTNPVSLQLTNWFVWFRNLLQLADVQNIDEVMGTNQLIQQVVENALGAAEGEGEGPSPPASQAPAVQTSQIALA